MRARRCYFQNVLQYQLEVLHARHGLGQQGRQALVHLDGHHLGSALGQLLGQHADAGADLQHAPALIDAAGVHDLGRQARIDDEVLSKALGEREIVFFAQAADNGEVGQLRHSGFPFCCSPLSRSRGSSPKGGATGVSVGPTLDK